MLHFQRWKMILVFGVVIAGILFALPNLFPAATMARLPAWLPHKQVNLGLDLQGGAHLLYQLDEKEMIGDWLNTIRGDVRETLRARPRRLHRPRAERRHALGLGEDPRRCRHRQGLCTNCASSRSRSVATCSRASPATTWTCSPRTGRRHHPDRHRCSD